MLHIKHISKLNRSIRLLEANRQSSLRLRVYHDIESSLNLNLEWESINVSFLLALSLILC